jgi:hypothetical protein
MSFIECPICPVMKEKVVNYVLDVKKIFSPLFRKNNYHKHLGYSYVLTTLSIMFMMGHMHLADTGLFFQTFVGGFGAAFVNAVREWYYGKYYGAPWDGTDINMGSYGGILGALTGVYLYSLL